MPYDNYRTWKEQPLVEAPVISVVVPCYNERGRIVPTVGAIASHVSDLGVPWELIIADDGSTDDTVDRVRATGLTNLRVVPAPRNLGKGAAVRRGMMAARGAYLLFADADCSTPIQELDKLLAAVHDGRADVAIGSRAASGSEAENRSAGRRIATAGLRLVAQRLLGTRVEDTQCGFKLFSSDAARRLFSRQTIDGFSFDLELLFLARQMEMRVVEVPVHWFDAPGSKVEPLKEARRFLRDVVRIRLNGLRGVYADG
ncbi:MAG: glycosyltransferase family 2 protein [Acidimicrobiia bacterium]|nr:glycosyltransferase family 2 protein [Acidimicrobiia bacterium]